MGYHGGRARENTRPVRKPIVRRAAQYVRMSTDHQRYSIESQISAIAEYALCHDFEIVRTYADEGRSGVKIKGREALQRLLSDVQGGTADFDAVLVYDVSRWGRFQDADESAYHEFTCKAAGIEVIYCAELFENDGSVLATLFKVMKRAMAGEYSRELSVKVSRAHRRQAQLGFHQGGPANYGLRRVLVDSKNVRKMPLRHGEAKSLQGDRVILVKGPEHEAKVVREIFRLFVIERMTLHDIARHLNSKRLRNRRGNPWTIWNVIKMLNNEKYAGTFVYGMTSWPLLGGRLENPPDTWVRVENAIEPIVDQKTFESAQVLLKDSWKYTDNDLLDHLAAAWCVIGYLSAPRLNKCKFTPTPITYRQRFGSLLEAYRLVGYRPVHAYRYSRYAERIRVIHRDLVCKLTSLADGRPEQVSFNAEKQTLEIDGLLSVVVIILPFLPRDNTVQPGWKLYANHIEKCDAILLARMNKVNSKVLDYHLLSPGEFAQPRFLFTDQTIRLFRHCKLESITAFYDACEQFVASRRQASAAAAPARTKDKAERSPRHRASTNHGAG